jgi:hypothetical protein
MKPSTSRARTPIKGRRNPSAPATTNYTNNSSLNLELLHTAASNLQFSDPAEPLSSPYFPAASPIPGTFLAPPSPKVNWEVLFAEELPEDDPEDADYFDELAGNSASAASRRKRNSTAPIVYQTRRAAPDLHVDDAELDRILEQAERKIDLNYDFDNISLGETLSQNYDNESHYPALQEQKFPQHSEQKHQDFPQNPQNNADFTMQQPQRRQRQQSKRVALLNDQDIYSQFLAGEALDDDDSEYYASDDEMANSLAHSERENAEEYRNDKASRISKREVRDLVVDSIDLHANAAELGAEGQGLDYNSAKITSRTRRAAALQQSTDNSNQFPAETRVSNPIGAISTLSGAIITPNIAANSAVFANFPLSELNLPVARAVVDETASRGFTPGQKAQLRRQVSDAIQLMLCELAALDQLSALEPLIFPLEVNAKYKTALFFLLHELNHHSMRNSLMKVPILRLWEEISAKNSVDFGPIDAILQQKASNPGLMWPDSREIGWPKRGTVKPHVKQPGKREIVAVPFIDQWFSQFPPIDSVKNSVLAVQNGQNIHLNPLLRPEIRVMSEICFTPAERALLFKGLQLYGYVRPADYTEKASNHEEISEITAKMGIKVYEAPNWALIQARFLPGRTEKQIRSHFYTTKRAQNQNLLLSGAQTAPIAAIPLETKENLSESERVSSSLAPELIEKVEEAIDLLQSDQFAHLGYKRLNFWQIVCQQFLPAQLGYDRITLRREYFKYLRAQLDKINSAKARGDDLALRRLKVPKIPPKHENNRWYSHKAKNKFAQGNIGPESSLQEQEGGERKEIGAREAQHPALYEQKHNSLGAPSSNSPHQRGEQRHAAGPEGARTRRQKRLRTNPSQELEAAAGSNLTSLGATDNTVIRNEISAVESNQLEINAAVPSNANQAGNYYAFSTITPVPTMKTRRMAAAVGANHNNSLSTPLAAILDVPTPAKRITRTSSSNNPTPNRANGNIGEGESTGVVFEQMDFLGPEDEMDDDYTAQSHSNPSSAAASDYSSDSEGLEPEIEEEFSVELSDNSNNTYSANTNSYTPFNPVGSKRRILQQDYSSGKDHPVNNSSAHGSDKNNNVDINNSKTNNNNNNNNNNNSIAINSNNNSNADVSGTVVEDCNNSGQGWSREADVELLSNVRLHGTTIVSWPIPVFVKLCHVIGAEVTIQMIIHRLTYLLNRVRQLDTNSITVTSKNF